MDKRIGIPLKEERKRKISETLKGRHCSLSTEIKKGERIGPKTEFKKANPPPPHKSGCKCFRCSRVPWNKGKPYNKGYRFPSGENHPCWKGGISLVNDRKRDGVRKWRKEVLIRDNFSCVLCGNVGGILEVHHIKRFRDYPELRANVNNGITLCQDCHKEITKKERK